MLPGAEEATNCKRMTAMERDTLRPQLADSRLSQTDPLRTFIITKTGRTRTR